MPPDAPARDARPRSAPDQPATGVRIRCADWLDAARELDPASVDLLYADPPFNTGRAHGAARGGFDDRWPSPDHHLDWLRARLLATLPTLAPSANILIHVDWRTCHRVRTLLDDLLGPDRFVNHLIWSYGLGGSSARRFARKHDDILFYCADPERYWFDPPRVPARSRRMAGKSKKATDVLDIPAINNMAAERVGWPTQKPLALLSLLVGACCPPGGLILDPCCGSGTTLVAARLLDRRAIGVDLDPRAATLAAQRVRSATPRAPREKT